MADNLDFKLKLEDLFTTKMIEAIKQTQKLEGAVDKANSKLKDMGSSANKSGGMMSGAMTKIGGAIVAAFAVDKIVDFGKAVIESLSKYQMFMASTKAMLGGDIGMAEALNTQLVSLASKTPFSLDDTRQGAKQLMAYGWSVGQITKDLKMIGDVSSGVGAPLTDIIYLYGTLKTQGRAYTRDIMQFTSRGIPIISELAKQFKVSENSVKDLVESGKVGFPEVERAMKSLTSQGGLFFNMMDEQSKTVGGKISNMGDAWEQLKTNIGKSQTGIIASIVRFSSDSLSAFNDNFNASNIMEDAWRNKSLKGWSFWEKEVVSRISNVGTWFGMNPVTGGYTDVQQYTKEMYSQKVATSSTKGETLNNISSLSNIIANMYGDKTMKSGDREKYVSVLQQLIVENKGILKTFNKETAVTAGTGKEATPTKDEKMGSIESNRAGKNIYITIDKLIEKQIISTTNLKESLPEIKSLVTAAMIEAVNDINHNI